MPDTRNMTPAQTYALVFGATLLLVGIVGFAVNSSFDTGTNISTGDKLIVFELNGWHNLVHIASGLLGLAMFRSNATARLYALGFGAVYLLVTIIGFADGTDVIGLIPVNTADNFLHLAIAGLGIAAGLASPDTRRTTATA
jgi:hypothetical protein